MTTSSTPTHVPVSISLASAACPEWCSVGPSQHLADGAQMGAIAHESPVTEVGCSDGHRASTSVAAAFGTELDGSPSCAYVDVNGVDFYSVEQARSLAQALWAAAEHVESLAIPSLPVNPNRRAA